MIKKFFQVLLIAAIVAMATAVPALAWHGQTSVSADCSGWSVHVDTTWNGHVGQIESSSNLSGTWAEGQTSVGWSVTVVWKDRKGVVLDRWSESGTIHKPDCCEPEPEPTPTAPPPTEEPTIEPTPEVTPTDEPTEEPTPEVTPTPTTTPVAPPPPTTPAPPKTWWACDDKDMPEWFYLERCAPEPEPIVEPTPAPFVPHASVGDLSADGFVEIGSAVINGQTMPLYQGEIRDNQVAIARYGLTVFEGQFWIHTVQQFGWVRMSEGDEVTIRGVKYHLEALPRTEGYDLSTDQLPSGIIAQCYAEGEEWKGLSLFKLVKIVPPRRDMIVAQ